MTEEMLKKQLKDLPAIADHELAGLKADEALRYKILRASRGEEKKTGWTRQLRRAVPAFCAALVLCVCGIGWNAQREPMKNEQPLIVAHSAGEAAVEAPRMMAKSGVRDAALSGEAPAPGYRSIWEGSNSDFPLIGIDGQYYRLLSGQSGNLGGSSLGSVTMYTSDPALAGAGSIVSNVCPEGTPIYGVNGMGGTLICAEVNGSPRMFQRVSFNGSALKGGESLRDTLQIAGRVTAMTLSDVGTVTDGSVLSDLCDRLLNGSAFDSAGSMSGNQSLLISLNNGVTLQLSVKNDRFSACGTWVNSDFFDAFRSACGW